MHNINNSRGETLTESLKMHVLISINNTTQNAEETWQEFEKLCLSRKIRLDSDKRHRATIDIKTAKFIKDANAQLLAYNKEISLRWREYYKELLNEDPPRVDIGHLNPIPGPISFIEPEEVRAALLRMKSNKVVVPDKISVEVWKKIGRHSKGDVGDCGNYRAIKLMSHIFKIWERVIIKLAFIKYISITENQCGFAAGKSTTYDIQTLRILMGKYRTNNKNLHLVFIDLEKTFDRVNPSAKTPAELSENFEVKMGVHQGSALSPFLLNLVVPFAHQSEGKNF
ncbi:uncharacterized protein LOC129614454 [Condylostylus longicornis]|uniref:uncharacterized protein LOC129614454 n=1 Tax=Condylostylus longicornis TaxID=2530218 RepID=UPI00244E26CB|nr:uncharacterized protein LOC129614454 [Condylostylus longicornis]